MRRKVHSGLFAQGSFARTHLDNVARLSADLPGTVTALEFIMERYSDTGTNRPVSCRIVPIDGASFRGEWFIPPEVHPDRRCLYIHGGGWVAGSVDTHRHLIDAIAMVCGCAIFALDYRLAPAHPFPAGLEDCIAAEAWLHGNGHQGPSRASHVTVMGDSAGGNYAAALTIAAIRAEERGPDALVLISPLVDFRSREKPRGVADPVASGEGREPVFRYYATNAEPPDDPLLSPLAAPAEILREFPPTLIQIGAEEYLRDQGIEFARALCDEGVAVQLSMWAHMPHVFQLFIPELACGQRAISEIAYFQSESC